MEGLPLWAYIVSSRPICVLRIGMGARPTIRAASLVFVSSRTFPNSVHPYYSGEQLFTLRQAQGERV